MTSIHFNVMITGKSLTFRCSRVCRRCFRKRRPYPAPRCSHPGVASNFFHPCMKAASYTSSDRECSIELLSLLFFVELVLYCRHALTNMTFNVACKQRIECYLFPGVLFLRWREEKREHTIKMKKMEQEMEEVFKMKVQEKKQKLLDSETDVGAEKLLMVVERLACNRNVRSLKAVQHYFPPASLLCLWWVRAVLASNRGIQNESGCKSLYSRY